MDQDTPSYDIGSAGLIRPIGQASDCFFGFLFLNFTPSNDGTSGLCPRDQGGQIPLPHEFNWIIEKEFQLKGEWFSLPENELENLRLWFKLEREAVS